MMQRRYASSTQLPENKPGAFVSMTGPKHGVRKTTSADIHADDSDGHSITSTVRQRLAPATEK